MNSLLFLNIKKKFRAGEIINLFFMIIISLLSIYKESFIPFISIPILFNDIFNYPIWRNEKEKEFFLQFERIKLKPIFIIKGLIFLSEFNLIYITISLTIFYFYKGQIDDWIALNLIVLLNMLIGSMFLGFSLKKKSYLVFPLKLFLTILINLLIVSIIILVQMYTDLSSITLLCLLLILLYTNWHCLNNFLITDKKIYLHND